MMRVKEYLTNAVANPVATLGMAAVFLLMKDDSDFSWKKCINLIKWCICWGIGYFGMWVGKWLMATLILNENIFIEAIGHATVHTAEVVVMEEHLNSLQVILRNIMVFAKWPYLLLILGVIAIIIIRKMASRFKPWRNLIPFAIVAVIPLMWLGVLKSHAAWLYWYTYRGLMATVFAVLAGLFSIMQAGGSKK